MAALGTGTEQAYLASQRPKPPAIAIPISPSAVLCNNSLGRRLRDKVSQAYVYAPAKIWHLCKPEIVFLNVVLIPEAKGSYAVFVT